MEELFYLPPRAQAPVINYGVAIGIRSRLAKRGAHNRTLTALLNRRRSSRPCSFVPFSLIDNHPDAGRRTTRIGTAASSTMATRSKAVTLPPSPPADSSSSQRLKSTLNFNTAHARHTALSRIYCASSNAPNPTGITALLPTVAT